MRSLKGTFLRRLYSTFACGWPGIGLLLMRLVVGSSLVALAVPALRSNIHVGSTILWLFLAGSGVLIIAGLWTPIAGTLVAAIEICHFFLLPGELLTTLLLATIAGALAMLGPGLWSIDARLFGWKRVEAPPRKSTSA